MNQTLVRISALLTLCTVLLFSCRKEDRECPGSTEKNFSVADFTRIEAGETFHITINKGDAFTVKAVGCTNDLEDLLVSVGTGNILNVRYKNFQRKRYRVDLAITLPRLTSVILSGASKTTVNGFGDQNSVIRNILSGTAECTLNGTGINTQVELSGASKLNVTGATLSLYGTISGSAVLHSFNLQSDEVDIATSGSAKAYVFAKQQLFVEASGASTVYYKGEPGTKNIVMSGAAKVVEE